MKCNGPDSLGKCCEFIRWKPESSSPPLMPVAPQAYAPTGSFFITSQPMPVSGSVFATNAAPGIPHCRTKGCGQTRIAPDCGHCLCRKHCIADRGCSSKTHASAIIPVPVPSSTATYTPTSPFSSTTTAIALPQIFPPPPTTPLSQPSQPSPDSLLNLDACPNPRFQSHMPAIFTDQWK